MSSLGSITSGTGRIEYTSAQEEAKRKGGSGSKPTAKRQKAEQNVLEQTKKIFGYTSGQESSIGRTRSGKRFRRESDDQVAGILRNGKRFRTQCASRKKPTTITNAIFKNLPNDDITRAKNSCYGTYTFFTYQNCLG